MKIFIVELNLIQIDERGETYRLWEGAMEGKSVKKLDVN